MGNRILTISEKKNEGKIGRLMYVSMDNQTVAKKRKICSIE